jgi:hypothetical protein
MTLANLKIEGKFNFLMLKLKIWHNDCDGEHIINPKYIADVFNNHFVNITENMDLNPNTDITYNEKLDNHIYFCLDVSTRYLTLFLHNL